MDDIINKYLNPYVAPLFSKNQTLGSFIDDVDNYINRDNLSEKNPKDKSQQVERNEFASFLIDSSNFYKTNRFFCVVFPPGSLPAVNEYYNKDKRGFKFNIEAVSIPEQTIETFDYKLGNNNPSIKMPYNMSYGDGTVTLTFRMSRNFLERKMFLSWQESVFSFNKLSEGGGPGANYYDDYCSNSAIILSQIDTSNNRIYNTIFKNVYPISVAGIEYSWNPQEDYVRQNVTFAFSRMFSEGTKQGKNTPEEYR